MPGEKIWLYAFCFALLLSVTASAAEPDRHLQTDPAREILISSAYLHGYIHGYEDGFREGDLDIHFDRQPRPLKEFKQFRKPAHRKEFGDRRYFCAGYQQGFRVAYADANQGRAFRGETEVRRVADGLAQGTTRDKEFDQAISAGYQAGHEEALGGGASPEGQAAAEHCLTGHTPGYCDIYVRGFSIGFSDARVTFQHQARTALK